jgi:mono/diheme cytochrome c family protein
MIRTGGYHYQEEGCRTCHGGPGTTQAAFAEQMRPEPPDLTKAAATWKDNELYWILQHGIKMTGMPAFGPTHDEKELRAMVAFVRRLPDMSPSEYKELTDLAEGEEDHDAKGRVQPSENRHDEQHGQSAH